MPFLPPASPSGPCTVESNTGARVTLPAVVGSCHFPVPRFTHSSFSRSLLYLLYYSAHPPASGPLCWLCSLSGLLCPAGAHMVHSFPNFGKTTCSVRISQATPQNTRTATSTSCLLPPPHSMRNGVSPSIRRPSSLPSFPSSLPFLPSQFPVS